LEWVAAIYVLALAIGLLPFGRFGDVYGRRKLFVIGLIGFTVASLVCGLAPDIQTLIFARAVKGLAAAMMVPQVLAIVHVIFPANEKSRVFGLFGTISSLAVVVGPVIGGALISADIAGLGWRMAFLINIPLGIAALVGTMRLVPHLSGNANMHPDWVGTCLFAIAATLLLLPLIEGRALGWPWWCFAAFAASVPAAVAFAAFERGRERRGMSALMPAALLANRSYMLRLALVTLFFSGIPGLFLVLAIFLQSGFGLSPLESGLVTTPFPVGVMLASLTTERLGNRHLSLRIASGAALLAAGMVGLLFVIRSTGSDLNPYLFIAPLLVCGAGMGVAIMSLFQLTMSSVSAEDAGAGSGAMQAFQQMGAALGIAIAGQIFFSVLGESGLAIATQDQRFVDAASQSTLWSIFVFMMLTIIVGRSVWKNRTSQM
jgi:MFS family permease